MVLITCVRTTSKRLQLETWEVRPSPVSHLGTNRPRSTKTLEARIETNNQGISAIRGPALQVLIPWVAIFDRPIDPNTAESDFLFTTGDFLHFANEFLSTCQ